MKKSTITISERERLCLEYLAEIYHEEEMNCTYFCTIAKETGLTERQARRSARALARKGLAEYVRGLIDQDGMLAGSGYMATFEGALLINPCKDCAIRLSVMATGQCGLCYEKSNAK